jgi:predicted nuclease of predicted toxin-antitoxin system
MRILADENIPAEVVAALRAHGHDVEWMLSEASGSTDDVVLARAQAGARVLITFDKDFGELAFRSRLPAGSGVVLFRVTAASPGRVSEIAVAALASRPDWAGHLRWWKMIEYG